MPTVPLFTELGKFARDLFSKGFNYGRCSVDAKTTAVSNGVIVSSGADYTNDSGEVCANIGVKHKWDNHGLMVDLKWTTKNKLSFDFEIDDHPFRGVIFTGNPYFEPLTGMVGGTINGIFKRDYYNLLLGVNIESPEILYSAVFGSPNFHVGLNGVYGVERCGSSSFELASTAYFANSMLTLSMKDLREYRSSLYQKVNENLDLGIVMKWDTYKDETKLGCAGKYILNDSTIIRGKINTKFLVGLSYEKRLHAGTVVTLSTLVDGKQLDQIGCHRFGVGVELEL